MARVERRVDDVQERYDRQVDRVREVARRQVAKLRRDEQEKIAAIREGATEISDNGVEFIASWEGLRLTAYRAHPSETYLTIGYGHYGPDVKAGATITKQRALELLRDDVHEAERAVAELVKVRLGQHQFDALTSFTFNCGVGAFADSDLLADLNARRFRDVPAELMRWVNAGGVPVAGLVNRRRAEAALFTK